MRTLRWLVLGAVVLVAMSASGAALGVGPWPGLAPSVAASSGDVRYTATRAHGSTTVKAIRGGSVIASATFAGAYGIPAVTSAGRAGGLSPDGRLLVLAEPPSYNGLRSESRFLLVSTGTLSRVGTIVLKGEFGFDAVSPDRRTLYLIQHVSRSDLVTYVVRAYDLRTNRLLARAIVDKREPDETMRGYPVARATSAGGQWVYTLYTRSPDGGQPFVHALNAAARAAFCIDLPRWPDGNIWAGRLELANDGRQLIVRSGATAVARIDTATLVVVR
jgi:hypothetical protein